jgi:hypothetical protein
MRVVLNTGAQGQMFIENIKFLVPIAGIVDLVKYGRTIAITGP